MSETTTINTRGQTTTRAQQMTRERGVDDQISDFQGKCEISQLRVNRMRDLNIKCA